MTLRERTRSRSAPALLAAQGAGAPMPAKNMANSTRAIIVVNTASDLPLLIFALHSCLCQWAGRRCVPRHNSRSQGTIRHPPNEWFFSSPFGLGGKKGWGLALLRRRVPEVDS